MLNFDIDKSDIYSMSSIGSVKNKLLKLVRDSSEIEELLELEDIIRESFVTRMEDHFKDEDMQDKWDNAVCEVFETITNTIKEIEKREEEINHIESLLVEGKTCIEIIKNYGYPKKKVNKISKIWESKGNSINKEEISKVVDSKPKEKKLSKQQQAFMKQKELRELAKQKIVKVEEDMANNNVTEEVLDVIRDNIAKAQENSMNTSKTNQSDIYKHEDVYYKRGDIVHVNNTAYEMYNGVTGKSRPAVVIQNNTGNYHSTYIIVAYMTSVVKKSTLPTHVLVDYSTYDNDCASVIMTEQLQTVSKSNVKLVSKLSETEIHKLDRALMTSLALDTYLDKQYEISKQRVMEESMDSVTKELEELYKEKEDEKVAIEKSVQTKEIVETTYNNTDDNEFKHLKVAEFYSDKFVFDVRNGVKMKKVDNEYKENLLSYDVTNSLSVHELGELIEQLQEVHSYMSKML